MNLSDYMYEKLLPESETVIGKIFSFDERKGLVLSLTFQQGVQSLWVMFQDPPAQRPVHPDDSYSTHRAMILDRMMRPDNTARHFDTILINGEELAVSASSHTPLDINPHAHMWLQHFIEAGIDFTPMQDIPAKDLTICRYAFQEESPPVSLRSGGDVRLSFLKKETFRPEPLFPIRRFVLEAGGHAAEEPYILRDQQEELRFYIDGIVRYDPREQWEEIARDENVRRMYREAGMSEEEIERGFAESRASLDGEYAADEEILLLQYETQDNTQLLFHTTEYLDRKPERHNSAPARLYMAPEGESRHGYPCRLCELTTVKKGYDRPVEVELIAHYRRVPEKRLDIHDAGG